ncbi:FtsK/SpoIIIE domain-containing protein [Nocardioides terrigena]|uniref:FtsK/SpoIIIE domain-containing protein n=1 Tax=Nocardioides terrigena TaxID=424797 RepID=UPI00131F2BBB|nr:FtsK/SpoIIIE domain-containing protein [Nocardioides terrigena]
MTERMRVDLEVSRTDSAPRLITLTAPYDVTTGAALDVLGAHLGLRGAAGAVQARSLVSDAWLDRGARLGDVGLLRGERLTITVGLTPGSAARPLRRWPAGHAGDLEGRVAINRPPRAVRREPTAVVPVPTRRRVRAARRFPWGAMLLPLVIGLLLVLVTRRWEIALFSLFTPVMVAWNHVEERRARRDELGEHGRTYAEECAATLDRVERTTDEWAQWLRETHPAPEEVLDICRRLTPRLWERQPGDPDFLHLRLGTGIREAPVDLRETSEAIVPDAEGRPDFAAAARVADVPVVVDLLRDGVVAVLGGERDLDRTLAWVAAQVAALHSPADVLVAAALSGQDTADWCRWLPHLAHGWLPCPPLATDRRATDALLAALAELAGQRRAEGHGRGHAGGTTPAVVVLVDDRVGPDPALLAAVVDARDVGITTVWFGTDARAVPTAAPSLHTVDGRQAVLVDHRGGTRLEVTPDAVAGADMIDLAGCLAPLRDAADSRRARSIPDRVSLEDLIPDVTSPVAVRRRWDAAPLTHLTARLGLSNDGPVELDLGPEGSHALVGGTTGSGKSELLQTLVVSIAAEYPPSRVGFLLVDYKGGAAFKDAMHLPHCVGVVTDLDQHLTRRVMQALDAEIRRREELLAAGDARDLTELRHRSPDAAPGDLLIVVDEFATLAKEIPAFVEGVVDIAARGRSLGLRLVLATQRPAGVINDRIRANVGVRIALRVNDEADSQDVIGQRDAAHIPRELPGRAYLQLHRDLDEFQSAYVGGPARTASDAAIEVRDHDETHPQPAARTAGATVLEGVVAASQQVMRLGRWAPPHVPWLPAMPGMVTSAELAARVPTLPEDSVVLGLADLPDQQAQRVVALDLEHHQSMLVFGTSRSGKTTVLRTVAAAFIERLGPDRLHVYGLDFAGHGLHLLEAAPQCAGVVGPDEPGRVARLVRRLTTTIEQRKRLMAAHGLTGFADLVRTSEVPVPRIVVLLDGYAGATAVLERVDGGRLLDRLERLIPDGPAVGVHVILTADRRAAVPTSLTSVVTTRLVLRMAERDDYALLGVEAALARDATLAPGRAFIQGSTEVQLAVVAATDPAAEHRALVDLMERARLRWPTRAPVLGRMPERVVLTELPVPTDPFRLPLGIGEEDVQPVALDLSDGHALVTGPPRSGRSTTLATLAHAARRVGDPPALVLLRTRRVPVEDGIPWDVGPVDVHAGGQRGRGLADVSDLLDRGRRVLLLCDDVDAWEDPASEDVAELVRRERERPLRVVATSDNRSAQRAYAGLVPELRKAKQGLLLCPDVELDGDVLGVRLRPPLEPLGAAGRGFLVSRAVAELVQIAQVE